MPTRILTNQCGRNYKNSITTNDNIKKSSICSPPITRPSSIASVLLSPHSSLVDSACSISNNEMPSHSQKMLQDTVTRLQQHLRQDDHNNNNNTFMNTLADLVAETININQSLAHLQSQQQQQQLGSGHSNNHLTNLQKSSERQINLLTDALQLIDNRRQQQTVMDHPASPPLSQSAMDNRVDIISPKPQKSLRISSQQQRQSTHSRAYTSYYEDTMNILSPNYTDDASSQHSNILTTSFNTKNRQQQHRRSIASVATAPVILPHYNKYLDQEITPTRQYYQQQQQTVSSRPVSGILHHNQPSSSYQQQQQQQERYYSSTVERQPSKPSSQSAFQPMTPRVHRLLSMYEAASKPTTLLMTNATTSPPMSPPSVQQQYHQEQVPYIDYRTRS
ncbi:hypothetical protein BC941DRAFT_411765 [Chlamydoabsidia padenii]|nr:hypothetical protein BC941DRAFT_411765 [Chlamydoabsidia padenii]